MRQASGVVTDDVRAEKVPTDGAPGVPARPSTEQGF